MARESLLKRIIFILDLNLDTYKDPIWPASENSCQPLGYTLHAALITYTDFAYTYAIEKCFFFLEHIL